MYKKVLLEFDIMEKNNKIQHCIFDGNFAIITDYENIKPFQRLIPNGTYSDLEFERIIETRCWDKNRIDTKEILKSLGLNDYNPYIIIQKTHGIDTDDWLWFLFKDEELKWEDVNPHNYKERRC